MKKLLIILLLVAQNAQAFSRVQICTAQYTGGGCGGCFAGCTSTTAGNALIVCWKTNGGGTSIDTTNANGGITWVNVAGARNAAGSGAWCSYALNIPGGATGLFCSTNCTSQSTIGMEAIEYSGVGPFDVTSSTAPNPNTVSSITSNSFTTTDTDLIFAFWGNQQNAGPYVSAGTNYTTVSHEDTSYQASVEWLGASAGAHVASMNLTSGGNANAMTVLSFKTPPPVTNSPMGIHWAEF